MANSSSNLFNNLAKEILKIKCKYGHDNKKCGKCGIKYKDSKFCFEYANFKNNLIEEKCLCCNKNYQKNFHENLKKGFANKYKFVNQDINKFILLLPKGVYPYKSIDDWEKINETSLPEKEDTYSRLNMKDIMMQITRTQKELKFF